MNDDGVQSKDYLQYKYYYFFYNMLLLLYYFFSEVVFKMNDEGGMDRSIDHRGGTPQTNCLPFFFGLQTKTRLIQAFV
jgi:hypothetical protein